MRRSIVVIAQVLSTLALLLLAVSSFAASTIVSIASSAVVSLPTMTAYCQAPPLKQAISPNIMLAVDVSGSMSWAAYSYGDTDANHDGILDHYDPGTIYEGYFIPSSYYAQNSNGVYQEVAPTGIPCTPGVCQTWSCQNNNSGSCDPKGSHGCNWNKYACCSTWSTVPSGDCGVTSGNYLNYALMHRIDLLRWAMTGGTPSTCSGNNTGGTYCDPQQGNAQPTKVGSVCSANLGYCILLLDDGKDEVQVPYSRVMAGLAFKLQTLPVIPRMGSLFFSGNGVLSQGQTYIGDFTASTSKDAYTFDNLIAAVNSVTPNGSTPTGPALWDIMNYYAQKNPQYGGFQVSGSNKWADPMYDCADKGGTNCKYIPCADNFVILLSDGEWNQPGSKILSTSPGSYNAADSDPVVPAYEMHMGFMNTQDNVLTSVRGVYTIGLFMNDTTPPSGLLAMQNVAMYGSFDKTSKTWPGGTTFFPQTCCGGNNCNQSTCSSTCNSSGSLCTSIPASSGDWDSDGDGVPDTFNSGENATSIRDSLLNAILDILSHTSAGTAASVLASREGSGANLLQAVYYPKRPFPNQTISWAGSLQNLWYYIDPGGQYNEIREDGRDSSGNHDFILNLNTSLSAQKDYITQFRFDSGLQAAVADRWTDNNGDGSIVGETQLPPIKVDQVANLWEAGQQLWSRSWLSRVVYTSVDGATRLNFKCIAPGVCNNAAYLARWMNATDSTGAFSTAVASTLMEWTLGNDTPFYSSTTGSYVPSYRSRQAQIGTTTSSWKLGDIVNSTPKISTWQPLGDYNLWYYYWDSTYGVAGLTPYQSDPVNPKTYITGYVYKGRGMVYAGGNDGMLHAFVLGLLQTNWSGQGQFEKAKLTNHVCSVDTEILCDSNSKCPSGQTCTNTNPPVVLGQESWAFIPKNVLPYLKYMADPSYCHVYTVDLTPLLFDASIGVPSYCHQADLADCVRTVQNWRTILIGGMRLGGGCRNPTDNCSDPTKTSCVDTPVQDPTTPNKGVGYSSYFALDITNQGVPKVMWEYDGTVLNADGSYTNKLGMAYSGAAVVRVNNPYLTQSDAAARNGKWFVIFGSGPTGPIDSANNFLGKSDQNLTLHIFDLAVGPGVNNQNVKVIDTGETNAFSGSITVTSYDLFTTTSFGKTKDYSDDVLYVPYTKDITNGGIGRLVINGWTVSNWKWSEVITNTGPITEAPQIIRDDMTENIWLLFGTGRYFYDSVASTDDADPAQGRQLFGMKEYCLSNDKGSFLPTCPGPIVFCGDPNGASTTCGSGPVGTGLNSVGLTKVDDVAVAAALESSNATASTSYNGWYIDLDKANQTAIPPSWGERSITNPSATGSGLVYFTTFKPQNDPCHKDGQTNIWAVKFDTGGAPTAAMLGGTALIQLSTGSIEQVNLATAFTEKSGRRTTGMIGQPPTREGLTLLGTEPGTSVPLFIKER